MTLIELKETSRLDLTETESYLFNEGMEHRGLIGRYDNNLVAAFMYEPDFQDYEYAQMQYMH